MVARGAVRFSGLRAVMVGGLTVAWAAPVKLAAQSPVSAKTVPVAVRGIAYDSLHGKALGGALVNLVGTSRSALTDEYGRFTLKDVPPGSYVANLQHSALDAIGLPGITTRVVVRGESDSISLSIPSFATLWVAACGTSAVPQDSGFLFGSVRNAASDQPAANAVVTVSFLDVSMDSTKSMRQRRGSGEAETDANGSYALCGIPVDLSMRVVAGRDSLITDLIDVPTNSERIRRLDLLLGNLADRKTATSVVRGVVHYRESGAPASNVRILSAGSDETRTNNRGEFVLRDVPFGTRQIEALSVSTAPASVVVNVRSPATNDVAISLDRVTLLEKLNVTAVSIRQVRINEMELRRERRLGTFLDSTSLVKYPSIGTALSSQISDRALCEKMFIDGIQQRTADKPLAFLSPQHLAVIEAHQMWSLPIEYKVTRDPRCYTLLVWTKMGLP